MRELSWLSRRGDCRAGFRNHRFKSPDGPRAGCVAVLAVAEPTVTALWLGRLDLAGYGYRAAREVFHFPRGFDSQRRELVGLVALAIANRTEERPGRGWDWLCSGVRK